MWKICACLFLCGGTHMWYMCSLSTHVFVWACHFNLNSTLIVIVTWLQSSVHVSCVSFSSGSCWLYRAVLESQGLLTVLRVPGLIPPEQTGFNPFIIDPSLDPPKRFWISKSEWERTSLLTGIPSGHFPSDAAIAASDSFEILSSNNEYCFQAQGSWLRIGSGKKKKRTWSKLNETKANVCVSLPQRAVNKVSRGMTGSWFKSKYRRNNAVVVKWRK